MGNALAQDAHGRPPDPLELEFPDGIFNTIFKGKEIKVKKWKREKEKENKTTHIQVISSNQVFLKRGFPENQVFSSKNCINISGKYKKKKSVLHQNKKSDFATAQI